MQKLPFLIEEKSGPTLSDLEARFPKTRLLVADFYVRGVETGVALPWGFEKDNLENVDHHAPVPSMTRLITSTALACKRRVTQNTNPFDQLMLNHTDCDSVLSAAILLGHLEPDILFEKAAIASDHTGEENDIADLLQALEHERDFALSLRCLQKLMASTPQESKVQALIDKRRESRRAVQEAVVQGSFSHIGPVWYAAFQKEISGEFLFSALPEAAIMVAGFPNKVDPNKWNIKVRRGAKATEGTTLHQLNIKEFDPGFGGRWNAGSNDRGGGTVIHPSEYAQKVYQAFQKIL
ncbi:MAG: hypothetical protein A2293_07305 [Elusimicrobia bacterium RIFOXYB2_FULL_49_7]|nr:MAG: hypothetical protein A2293_07305 [Elusimicrobia bacterium RIFOXYB2_FULL_49_7]